MRGFLKLSWVELKLFVRDPFATVFALVFPFIMLLLLAAVFSSSSPTEEVNGRLIWRGANADDYYVAASIGIVIAAIGLLALPVHLAAYREQGVLRRFRASSVRTWSLFGSQLIVSVAIATVGSLLMTLVAAAIYGTGMPQSPVGVLAAFLLASVCFTGVGFLLAAILPTSRAALGIGLILFFGAWMLSGTGPPRAVLPATVFRLGGYEPLTRVVIAIQDPWFGNGWNLTELAIVAGIAILVTIPAIRLFRWD
jgi:ABC-2 type transport system permease protein